MGGEIILSSLHNLFDSLNIVNLIFITSHGTSHELSFCLLLIDNLHIPDNRDIKINNILINILEISRVLPLWALLTFLITLSLIIGQLILILRITLINLEWSLSFEQSLLLLLISVVFTLDLNCSILLLFDLFPD